MDKKDIIFFGGVGKSYQFGGELTKNKEIICRLEELGGRVTVIDSYKSRTNLSKFIRIMCILWWSILARRKSTFIFSTSFGNIYPLFKILYWLPINRHIIYWAIGGTMAERVKNGIYQKKYLSKINLFIMEGMKMKEQMEALGFKNVLYKPNFKKIGKIPIINKFNDGLTHFLFISRIIPEKGVQYILNSMEQLNRDGLLEKYVVDFFGNIQEHYKKKFTTTVNALPNANYKGTISLLEENNYDVLSQYHFMLFPTYWVGEGFPGVVIDAYKAGIPIICSDWNFTSEFVKHGETGFIVPAHSQKKLYFAMKKAIQEELPNDIMSKKCQESVYQYDTRSVIDAELFDMLTGKTKK